MSPINFKIDEAAINADTAFTVELCRVYGTQACNKRYQMTPHADAGIEAARAAKLAADNAWQVEMKRVKS